MYTKKRFVTRVLTAACALGILTSFLPAASSARQTADQEDLQVRPVHVVVLVDESGSIDQNAMDREKDAASLIALGEFAKGSTVSVIGFASDAEGSGGSPVDPVCALTPVASPQDRETLASCIAKLRKREKAEGDGTDHAAAMQQALSTLAGVKTDGSKIIFLLTDGKLDVSDSPNWGKDNVGDRRNVAARAALRDQLKKANESGIQVWPLGFGQVDTAQLGQLAAGGSQLTCGDRSAKPEAKIVANPNDVVRSMLQAFRASRCAGGGDITETQLRPGGTAEATVDIPAIASDGSILVFRRDSRIAVSYVDPAGRLVTDKMGSADGQTFQVSGEGGPVEALRVVDPIPGKWTVRFTADAAVPPQAVSTAVVWQGAARAVLTVDPPGPTKEQNTVVSIRLQTRKNAIVDLSAVTDLSITAKLTGAGFAEVPITMADNGQAPDTQAADGQFSGQVSIPASATGPLRFTGSVSGTGIQRDDRTQDAQVAPEAAQIRAQARLTEADSPFVPPGGQRHGVLNITNATGQERKARLVIADASPGAAIAATPAVFSLPASGDASLEFDLVFANNTVVGVNSGTLRVVDDANPDQVWHQLPFTVAVSYPPSVLRQLLWLWLTLAALVTGTAVYLLVRLRTRSRMRDVRGLRVVVAGAGQEVFLDAQDRKSAAFPFAVSNEPGSLKVDHPSGAEATYTLRRTDAGGVRLTAPDGHQHELDVGKSVQIGPEFALRFEDRRRTAQPLPWNPRPATQSPPGGSAKPVAATASPAGQARRQPEHPSDGGEPDDLL